MNEPAIAFRPRVVTTSDTAIASPIGESTLLAAEQAYRRILTVQPKHVRTLCSLAMVRLQLGDANDAHALLGQAAEVTGQSADAHLQLGRSFAGLGDLGKAAVQYKLAIERDTSCMDARVLLGNTLCNLGDIAAAVSQFEDALAIDDGSADAHQGLGLALQRLGQFERAMSHHEAALSVKPQLAVAHAGLGDACRQLGRHEDAIAHYKDALAINPRAREILLNLGGCYQLTAQRDAAISTFQQILVANPHLAEAHYNLGNLYLDVDNGHAAIFHYERAIAERPGFAEAHNNLANALQTRGQTRDAIAHYREAIRLAPRDAVAKRNLGNALRAEKRFDEAILSYQAAHADDPNDTVTLNHLAGTLMVTGRLAEAARAYEAAIDIAPENVGIQLNYAAVKRFTADDPRLPCLQQLLDREQSLSGSARIALHFTLGKAYADLSDGDRSFRHLESANALQRQRQAYDEHQTLRHMQRVANLFTRELLRDRANLGNPSRAPVFIVGMPRSGTSLIEQILASHPDVFGAGEVNHLAAAIDAVAGRFESEYPDMIARISGDDLQQLAKTYLAAFPDEAASAARIVDKMLSNFLYLGLIHLAFPNARIIHVRRNPIDTSLSCYSLWFAEAQPFAYDLGELGRYYTAYDALMSHWRAVLPEGTMLEVQYEDVVRDIEQQARALVSHCGLDWDNRCLAFHETKRPVDTASLVQVRQPLFSNSIGRWRLYGAHLNPLFDAIGANAMRSAIPAVPPAHPKPEPLQTTTSAVSIERSSPVNLEAEQSTLSARIAGGFAVAKKLQDRGDHQDAESLFNLILVSEPRHFGALIGLGVISTHANRFEEAKRHFTRAISIEPKSAEAHGSLGAVHAAEGASEAAVGCYLKALSLAPDHPGILYSYAMALQGQGKADEAMAVLRRAIDNKPQHLDAQFALGNLHYAAGNDVEAARCYLKVLEFSPEHAETHNNIGNVLLRQGHHERGIEHYKRAIASRPDYADAYGNLGNALLELNRLEDSIAQNLRALEIKPHRFGSYNNLGVAYQALGRFEEATQAFTRAIELSPDEAPIHLNLANMEKFKAGDDRRLPGLRHLLARVDELDTEKQIAAHFAMGKALADLKDYDEAFQHLQKGNVLKRSTFVYDEAQRLATMDNVAAKFTPELMRALSGHGDPSWAPIFIVGMPRSGTTLMEQVLASHSRVFGAGELETFKELIGECAKSQRIPPAFPELINSLPPERITELGQLYTSRVRALAPEAVHIVDKMPLNFLFVGLIHLALPKAKIVHIQRDAMDNCVSCYQLLFTGSQPFAYDQAELGHYYRGYERVMAHWRKVLPPGVMIDVKYEELVDDLEGVSRSVLGHCGLDWEDSCRDFQSTERAVRTASLMQVREPLYRTAIGSWQRYAKFLGPMREALGLDAPAS